MKENTRYYLLTAAANMPNSCKFGRYKRIGIVESLDGTEPKMIRTTSHCKVLATWEKLSVGKTEKCAFNRAMAEAKKYLADLGSIHT